MGNEERGLGKELGKGKKNEKYAVVVDSTIGKPYTAFLAECIQLKGKKTRKGENKRANEKAKGQIHIYIYIYIYI